VCNNNQARIIANIIKNICSGPVVGSSELFPAATDIFLSNSS